VTPHRTTNDGVDRVPPFPIFRAVIAPDGTSATLNGQVVPTAGFVDLLAAVHAAAATAATHLGNRPVRMDLTTPTGQVRHLTAHPCPTGPDPAGPDDAGPDHAWPEQAVAQPADAVLDRRPQGAAPAPARADDPAPHSEPAGDPMGTQPTTPLPAQLNGAVHQRLTPLDDPLPRRDTARPADTPTSPAVQSPAAARPLRRPRAEDRWLFGPTSDGAPREPAGPAAAASAPHTGGAPPAPVPPLQPAGLLPRLRPTAARPMVGWQARVHVWTRGRVTPPLSAAERRHRELVTAVQAPFTGPRLVAVVNPKGGAGKTPAVLAAAATWGAHRGSVIAWDDNETRGTLGMRALADPRQPTVAGLLADLPHLEEASARVGDLAAYLRPQGDARFDVLASDEDPARMAQFGAVEFTRVRYVLARFYGVTVVDTGNNVRAGNWQAAVDTADQLLVVSTYQRDSAVTASWTLDHLYATGRGHLADRAVTVLSAATPSTDRRTRAELREHFATRTRAVVEVPYDPVIADGNHLDLTALRPGTRDAWLHATAALTDGLAR